MKETKPLLFFAVMFFQRLSTKFSLLLLALFLLSGGVTTLILSNHLNHQAEQVVKERAEILLSTLQAARDYTQNNIQPLLEKTREKTRADGIEAFSQESIPTFAAKEIFSDFQQQSSVFAGFSYQDFSYKEAAINPTSPKDKADDFESEIFAAFRSMQPDDKRMSGYRVQSGQKLFYLARPLYMKDASCLACHGAPEDAPPALLDMYGENGFGWQLGDVVAAQMIYVPADSIFERGQENLWTVTKILASIFAAIFVVVNLLLWRTVTKPLALLTRIAKQISHRSTAWMQDSRIQDRLLQPDSPLQAQSIQAQSVQAQSVQAQSIQTDVLIPLVLRKDEPGQLARAFGYMVQVLGRREQDLQQAVQARTRSLEAEMQQRQSAQDALQTYAHAINHDLRNLVMGISMVIQGLLRNQERSAEIAVDTTALIMIKKSCDRQLNLMNSLVDVRTSEIWRTVLNPELISLPDLIQEIEDRYQAKLKAHTAQIKVDIFSSFPAIKADPSQLKRVFENLIDNSLKYNAQKYNPQKYNAQKYNAQNKVHPLIIHINASIIRDAHQQVVRCVVADNGVGLSAADTNDLFKIYARGHRDRQTLGDGLGLYICRKIIDAHGGNIGIDDTASSGAAFWFTLPV